MQNLKRLFVLPAFEYIEEIVNGMPTPIQLTKGTDQMIFMLAQISTPNTFFVNNHDISQYVESIEDICGYPLIIKDITGRGGNNSVLVNDRIELL